MSEAKKQATGNQLLIRSGGFALSLPIVALLTIILLMVNFLMGSILFLTLLSDGTGIFTNLQSVMPALSLTFALGMATMLGLFYAVLRYVGGLRNLWLRLRGIRQERARVERLIDKQNSVDDDELLLYAEDDQDQAKYQ